MGKTVVKAVFAGFFHDKNADLEFPVLSAIGPDYHDASARLWASGATSLNPQPREVGDCSTWNL